MPDDICFSKDEWMVEADSNFNPALLMRSVTSFGMTPHFVLWGEGSRSVSIALFFTT